MKRYLFLALLFIGTTQSFANTLSVRENTVDIRDSVNPYLAQVILVVPQYYPLLVLDETERHYQVRDFQGHEGWVERSAMAPIKSVVVKVDNCNIRNGPGSKHEVLFRADRGVAFKVLDKKADWLKVKHANGQQGWIYEGLVWGLNTQS